MAEAQSSIPDHGSLEEGMPETGEDDPWRSAAEARREYPPGSEAAEFDRFREFMVSRQASANRSWRPRRDRSDDDEDRDTTGDRSNAGPAPTWDGSTAFKDYQIRAKLWLATTRTKPKARGPMLLKSLSGTPFDDMKYLAKDNAWMDDPSNGEKLISLMDSKDLCGDDQREDMINTLVKITYTLRRAKGESNKVFFARWDNIVRKLQEHQVKLPEEYLGFLLTNALNLSNEELKLLLNFTQGRLKVKDVKEWLRVHETEFETKQVNKVAAQKSSQVFHMAETGDEASDGMENYGQEDDQLEVLLGALQELDEEQAGDGGQSTDDVFDEHEAKEVLATMVKEHAKGGGKRTFATVNKAKKAKALARGYGASRDAGGRFREGPAVKIGGSYKVSIEALKRRTRCAICREVGHWHKECPKGNGGAAAGREAHYLESEEALFLDYIEYLDFKKNADEPARSSHEPIGPPPGLGDPRSSAAYTERLHELNFVERHEPISEDQCATVDTGCQRTAIGAETLNRFLASQEHKIGCCFKPETHCFKSVNGLTRTTRTACLPTSLGQKGCILRPAVFEEGQSRQAPFLLSLPFMIYCRATLSLDPQTGLSMHLRRFNHHVPLHIGPTGALRVPLDKFTPKMLQELSQVVHRLASEPEVEVHHVFPEAGPSSSNHLSPAVPEESRHDALGISPEAQPAVDGDEQQTQQAGAELAALDPSHSDGHGQRISVHDHDSNGSGKSGRTTPTPDPQDGARLRQGGAQGASRCHRGDDQRGVRFGEIGDDGSCFSCGVIHRGVLRGGDTEWAASTDSRQDQMQPRRRGGDLDVSQGRTELPATVSPLPSLGQPQKALRLLPVDGVPALYWLEAKAERKKMREEIEELSTEQRKCTHSMTMGTGSNGAQKRKTCRMCSLTLEVTNAKTGEVLWEHLHWKLVKNLRQTAQDADMGGGPRAYSPSQVDSLDLASMMAETPPESIFQTPADNRPSPTKSQPSKETTTYRPRTTATTSSSTMAKSPPPIPEEDEYYQFLEWQRFKEFQKKSVSRRDR